MYVAQALREQGLSRMLSGLTFFLHIPFPPYDIFSKLPQQQRLLRALLQFDLLGFQTRRDVRNFIQCVRRVMLDTKVVPRRDLQLVRFEKREIRSRAFSDRDRLRLLCKRCKVRGCHPQDPSSCAPVFLVAS